MPSRKSKPLTPKENLPETTLLGRVSLSGVQKEPSVQEQAPVRPAQVDGPTGDLPEGTLSEPAPRTLRHSLFEQVRQQPGNPTLWILLGWSSADARRAVVYFRRALEVDPENPVAHDGLDWALSEIGPVEAPEAEVPVSPAAKPDTEVPLESQLELQAVEAAKPAPALQPAFQATAAVPARPRPRIRDFRWRTFSHFYQIPFFRNLSIAIAYLLLISTAEVFTVMVNPTIGIIFHATIMVGLIIHGSVIQQGPFRRFLVMLALAPLIRVLSLSLPLATLNIPIIYRYMVVGVPILLAAYFATRSVGLTANRLYFTWKGWPFQLLFSLIGLLFGYAEYLILRPNALVPAGNWIDIAVGAFILIVFTGFLEEFIFRSLMQVTGIQLFGGISIWIVSILFGIMHIGYFSAFDVIFAGTVGLFFGYFALKTHSLLGISLAHGMTNIALYIIFPLILH